MPGSFFALSTLANAVYTPDLDLSLTVAATPYGCMITRSVSVRGGKRRVVRRLPMRRDEMDFLFLQLAAYKATYDDRASAAIESAGVPEGEIYHEQSIE